MAESLVSLPYKEMLSNDNSTKEFLFHENNCKAYKDSDEEIKLIFNEIKKLSDVKNNDTEFGEDIDDVDLILKRAEDIALETESLLKSSPVVAAVKSSRRNVASGNIPQIKVTQATDNNVNCEYNITGKVNKISLLF